MTDSPIRRVLILLDDDSASAPSRSWLRRVLGPAGGAVRLLRVLSLANGLIEHASLLATVSQREDHRLATMARLVRVAYDLHGDGILIDVELRFGEPVASVLDAALSWGADAVAIVDRTPPSARGWSFTAVADELLRRSPVAVLLVRPASMHAA